MFADKSPDQITAIIGIILTVLLTIYFIAFDRD